MIFLWGDIHGEHEVNSYTKFHRDNKKILDDNPVIFLGDWGFLWSEPRRKSEQYWIDWFSSKSNKFYIVDGNHENHKLISELPIVEECGGKMRKLEDNIFFMMRGEIYQIDGKTFWAFGGAMSIDKAHRIEGKSWWPEEVASYEEMQYGIDKLESVNWKVDYVIAHTLPKTIVATMFVADKEPDPTSAYFDFVIGQRLEFKMWFCGHFHEDRNIYGKYQILYKTPGVIK